MLASLLLAATVGTAATALASPVDSANTSPTRAVLDTAVAPLPTYANFSSSCESITLFAPLAHSDARRPDQLRARCRDYAGTFHATQIDLNLCIGIDYENASLQWSIYGKFSEYCSRCWPAGVRVEMGCACTPLTANAARIVTNSTLDLDLGIGNTNGTLSCAGGTGSKRE